MSVSDWLPPALDYVDQWLGFQMRLSEQPGCAMAVVRHGEVVMEQAYGLADVPSGTRLSPRHRFRVASHSKTFTAAAIMRLREQGRVGLDDPVSRYVAGLSAELAEATLGQLLSHSAGLMRDGTDSGHWQDRQPFLDEAGLRAELAHKRVLESGERLKYSNLGFGLLGLVIESVTGEPFGEWTVREISGMAGLTETAPDLPAANAAPLATGHAGRLPLGRMAIPGHNPARALAAATGFVATAADIARFFGQLDPAASNSVLSPASRREMTRPHWRIPGMAAEFYYGLGTICGSTNGHPFFGHIGSFQGFQSRTCVVPDWSISFSVLTNAADGPAGAWTDGVLHILNRFAEAGPPNPAVIGWTGRWWSVYGATDLVPMGDKVMLAAPGLLAPFVDASELSVSSAEEGCIARASGFGSHGEPVRRTLDSDGNATAIRLGGTELLSESTFAAEFMARTKGYSTKQ